MERDVAIIGMACVFPRAPDLDAFWRNICDGVDAITDVPPGRWDPLFYDPASSAPDRIYTRRGGFIDEFATFDATAFGIMPNTIQGTEPEQLLALQVASDALADAGYAERGFARATTSVVLGRGHYVGPGMSRVVNVTRGAQQLVDSLKTLVPELGEAQLAAIKQDFQSRCGVYGADTAIGVVPNLLASRIANRLDLGGSAYTLDAACASSLVAVDHACRELTDRRADVAIAGGVHLCHDITFWSVFSQLGALSRNQQIRPFDRRADGLLIGEGIGMFVLKRLADARAAGDRIYAVVRGTGVASDGRDASLMTPRVDGQVLALTRAWDAAGLRPDTVGLVEAHGTATTLGDAAELTTLARVFGQAKSDSERVPLGSVKSMIGHAMPAAGAAGLMKAVLAVYHGVRPPTLHCDDPHPLLRETRFRTTSRAEPWDERARRAGVNAFGFGGINAHVIVDAPDIGVRAVRAASRPEASESAALVAAADSQEALLDALGSGRGGGEGSWRAAVFDPTPKRIATAMAAVTKAEPRRGRDGIYFAAQGLLRAGGKLAFMFPGVEAAFAPRIDDIARRFGIAAPELHAQDLEHQGVNVFALNGFLTRVLSEVQLRPDALAGHSIGEWSGMRAAGMFDEASVDDFVAALEPGTLQVADVVYVAAGMGADRLAPVIADLPGVVVSHDNCIHQAIVCGPPAQIATLEQRLRERRVLFEVLPFRSGFHSPALADHLDFYRERLGALRLGAPSVPLWSATTCAPYPTAPDAIRALFVDHLVKPVRFRGLVHALYDDGVRVFVQVGTGSLAAFVDDVLTGKPHHAVSLLAPQRSGLDQLRRACAALYVEGAAIDLVRLDLAKPPARVRKRVPLDLGVPLIRVELPPLRTAAPRSSGVPAGGDAVAKAFDATMRELVAAQEAVLQAFATPRPAARAPSARPRTAPETTRSERRMLSLDTYPELIDHCLVPQRENWPTLTDRAPTVPMTMSIELLKEAAARFDPSRVPIAVEGVLASAWLYVAPPAEVEIVCTRVDASRIRVKIGAHVEGTVTMAERYPDPPAPATEPLTGLREFPVATDAIYRDGWLFHGAQYQGVRTIDAFGTNGMRGKVCALPASGALLDAAGQLYGLWILGSVDNDRLAMPVRVGRVDFYGGNPAPDAVLDCTVWIRHLGRREVRADLELAANGRVHARISSWEDWRFETGGGIYIVMRRPASNLLATVDPAGYALVEDPGWRSATIEFLSRRFLTSAEREGNSGARTPQRQRDWLVGRIAAKDAVRHHLFARGSGPIFPAEITIEPDSAGMPRVRCAYAPDLRVSIAHKNGIGCAIVAEGADPGIDIEKIEPRSDGFAAMAFTPDEIALLGAADRDEALTRLWAAKEAAGKAQGTGLAGRPKRLTLTAVDHDRLEISGRWIATQRRGDYIIAWTTP